MKDVKWYGVLAIVVMVAYLGLTRWLADQVTQENEQRFNDLQLLQTELGARSIEDHFAWLLSETQTLTTYHIPWHLENTPASSASLENMLRTVAQQTFQSEILSMVYVDANGETVARYNALPEADHTLADTLLAEWLDDPGRSVRQSENYYVTPFYATAAEQLYGLLHPVYNTDGNHIGLLGIVLDFAPVLDQYVMPMRSGDYGAAWVQTATSYVVYDHEPDTIGRNVIDLAQPYPDLERVNQRLMSEESGTDSYHFTVEIGGDVDRKLVAWSTAQIGNQRLTLALSAPEDEINAELTSHRRTMLLSGLFLGFTLIVSNLLFYTTRQRQLERLVTSRTQALKDLNADLEARVTDRTAELTAKNAELTTILETMIDGVIFRRSGQVVYSNTAVTRLMGYTPDELAADPVGVQQKVVQEVSPAKLKRMRHAFNRALRQSGIHRENVKLTRKDGKTFYASIYMAPIIAPDGEQLGTLEIIHDISHEIALQEQKDRFITNASHELRRPLTNLKTRLYLLRQQPDAVETHLAVLERATDDMTALVQDLVDVAQLTRDVAQLDRQQIALQAVLESAQVVVTPVADQRNVDVQYTVPATSINITGDFQRLMHAFGNLITHAVNASPENATVYVNLASESGTNVMWGVLRVQDSEPHMSLSDLTHIFDPFYRPSEGAIQSTGLGLTIAQLIIEAHGGTVEVQNAPNGGITFTARLPYSHYHKRTT